VALILLGAIVFSPSPVRAANPVIYGVNMPLFDANEQLLTNSKTRALLQGWHTPIIRMPARTGLADSVELQALQAIKAIGATPVFIAHGAADANVLADDQHLLGLVNQVFGSSLVYVEYGNEEDLAGINDVTYTNSWNAVVPALKAAHPTYKFVGPVNFQRNPAYIGYFVGHANPAPDVVSWHEYVCSPTDNTQAVCFAHIANWATHVSDTNKAEIAAVGHTFPFMITEWNMDPFNDPRYLDPAVIGPWTAQALQELDSLVPAGLIGAQQYAVDSHGGGFELLDSNNALTPQGAAWQASLQGLTVPSPTANPSPSPSTKPVPSPLPAPSPTPPAGSVSITTVSCTVTLNGVPQAGTCSGMFTPNSSTPAPATDPVRFDFEDGTTQGWAGSWGAVSVANSTAQAASGTHSLAITTSSGYPAVAVRVSGLSSGMTVIYHVWSPQAGVVVAPFATDPAFHNAFPPNVRLNAGWNAFGWTVPSLSSVRSIGLQVNQMSGTIYLDAVAW